VDLPDPVRRSWPKGVAGTWVVGTGSGWIPSRHNNKGPRCAAASSSASICHFLGVALLSVICSAALPPLACSRTICFYYSGWNLITLLVNYFNFMLVFRLAIIDFWFRASAPSRVQCVLFGERNLRPRGPQKPSKKDSPCTPLK